VILCQGASWQESAAGHSGGIQTSWTPVFNTLQYVVVVVNFLSHLIFIFPLFLGYGNVANEFETKEKQKLTAT